MKRLAGVLALALCLTAGGLTQAAGGTIYGPNGMYYDDGYGTIYGPDGSYYYNDGDGNIYGSDGSYYYDDGDGNLYGPDGMYYDDGDGNIYGPDGSYYYNDGDGFSYRMMRYQRLPPLRQRSAAGCGLCGCACTY